MNYEKIFKKIKISTIILKNRTIFHLFQRYLYETTYSKNKIIAEKDLTSKSNLSVFNYKMKLKNM